MRNIIVIFEPMKGILQVRMARLSMMIERISNLFFW